MTFLTPSAFSGHTGIDGKDHRPLLMTATLALGWWVVTLGTATHLFLSTL